MSETIPATSPANVEGMALAVSDNRGFRTTLQVGGHALVADEPLAVGGTDTGPSPYGLISAALASCTAMTLHLYAKQKQLPVTGIRVAVTHAKVHELDDEACEKSDAAKIDRLERTLWIEGDIPDAARQRLLQMAERCPVHRTLQGSVRIVTRAG
jgi:putative redox protein